MVWSRCAQERPQNSGLQKGDVKQVPRRGPTMLGATVQQVSKRLVCSNLGVHVRVCSCCWTCASLCNGLRQSVQMVSSNSLRVTGFFCACAGNCELHASVFCCRRCELHNQQQHGVVFPKRKDVPLSALHPTGSCIFISRRAWWGWKCAVQRRECLRFTDVGKCPLCDHILWRHLCKSRNLRERIAVNVAAFESVS